AGAEGRWLCGEQERGLPPNGDARSKQQSDGDDTSCAREHRESSCEDWLAKVNTVPIVEASRFGHGVDTIGCCHREKIQTPHSGRIPRDHSRFSQRMLAAQMNCSKLVSLAIVVTSLRAALPRPLLSQNPGGRPTPPDTSRRSALDTVKVSGRIDD